MIYATDRTQLAYTLKTAHKKASHRHCGSEGTKVTWHARAKTSMRTPTASRRMSRYTDSGRGSPTRALPVDVDESPLVSSAVMHTDDVGSSVERGVTRDAPAASGPSNAPAVPARTPGLARRGPKLALGAESYDMFDFDQIADPFTDTRRAFMRGDSAPQQTPRSPARPPRQRPSEAELAARGSPSPKKSPFKRGAAEHTPHKSPAAPKSRRSFWPSPEREPEREQWKSPERPLQPTLRSPEQPKQVLEPHSPPRATPPRSPSRQRADTPTDAFPSDEALLRAPPQRSNRLLTQELLSWKQRYAELSDHVATLQSSAESGKSDTAAWSSEITALEQQIVELQRGRERDRRAMRQRVRVLETHMADAKIEYDSRYWRLLTSTPGTDEAAVELISTRNHVTRLQSAEADLRRRLRETQEQATFLVGLYKWRAQSASESARRADDLEIRNAELERQLEEALQGRSGSEQAPATSSSPHSAQPAISDDDDAAESGRVADEPAEDAGQESPSPPPQPAERPSSPDAYKLALPTKYDALGGPAPRPAARTSTSTPGSRPRGRPRKRPEPSAQSPALERFGIAPRESTSSAVSEPAPLPGATPMVSRTTLGEGTPMIDPGSPTRKKKRKLLGKGGGIFRLAEGTSDLAQQLDVPTQLSPVKPGAGMY